MGPTNNPFGPLNGTKDVGFLVNIENNKSFHNAKKPSKE